MLNFCFVGEKTRKHARISRKLTNFAHKIQNGHHFLSVMPRCFSVRIYRTLLLRQAIMRTGWQSTIGICCRFESDIPYCICGFVSRMALARLGVLQPKEGWYVFGGFVRWCFACWLLTIMNCKHLWRKKLTNNNI